MIALIHDWAELVEIVGPAFRWLHALLRLVDWNNQ